MSKKSFSDITQDALAAATAHALNKVVPKASTSAPATALLQPKEQGTEKTVQWNVRLKPHLREKLRNAAFAWRMTERDLIEAFIEQLPEVAVPSPDAPASVAWIKK